MPFLLDVPSGLGSVQQGCVTGWQVPLVLVGALPAGCSTWSRFCPAGLREWLTGTTCLGGWVPSEQICPQVQEVEEVREAHKAARKCTNGSNCGNGTKYTKRRKKEQLLGTRAGIKKDSYLLPGLNQGVCKRANITLLILHMPRAVGV